MMMHYGMKPKVIAQSEVQCDEMMFYQYLPIKLVDQTALQLEDRLSPFEALIGTACCDFVGEFGLDAFVQSNIYVTAKHMFQGPGATFNRVGWHCDGFLTDDINYIWSNCEPTIFNSSEFDLTLNDETSMVEMEAQALPENNFTYANELLLRLNQYSVHRVSVPTQIQLRTFFKLSFSKDKYDLIGNSKNPKLQYDWQFRPRTLNRNIPQELKLEFEDGELFHLVKNSQNWGTDKTRLWFTTKNPFLGGISPEEMIKFGMRDRLKKFITLHVV
jgi:hypothetical protein